MVFGAPTITSVEKVVDTNPDLYVRRAEQALRDGDVNAALAECDIAIEYSNESSHYVFEKVKILNHSGSFSASIDLIEQYIRKFKDEMDLHKLGEVYLYLHASYEHHTYPTNQTFFVASKENQFSQAREGFGVFFYKNGEVYVGDWKKFKRNGHGVLFSGTQRLYDGRWENDKRYNIFRIFFRKTFKLAIVVAIIYGIYHYYDDVKEMFMEKATSYGDEDNQDYQDRQYDQDSDEASEPEETYSRYVTVTAESANIRENPNVNSPVVTKALYNDPLLFLEEQQEDDEGRTWYHVRADSGAEGWISSSIVDGLDETEQQDVSEAEDTSTEEDNSFITEEEPEPELDEAISSSNTLSDDASYSGYMEEDEIEYENGAIYHGETQDRVPYGKGILTWPNGTSYDGQFENGQFNGYGTLTYDDGSVYVGNFSNNLKEGQGTLTWADGSVYEGEFQEDKRTGYGTMTWTDGTVYDGEFENGVKQGHGTITRPDGTYIEAEFENDQIVE